MFGKKKIQETIDEFSDLLDQKAKILAYLLSFAFV